MEQEKKLTIVIPVRNREGVIERTLDSVAAQTDRSFRLIVVDNGSTDQTREIVEKWIARNASEIEATLIDEPAGGASRARNSGLREVATPYVMFFDSDDEMRPDHVSRFLKATEIRPDADIIRWPVCTIDSDGWMKTHDRHFHDEMQLHLMHGSLSTLRYGVKTEFIRKCGGWNEELSTWDDLELGARMLAAGPQLYKLNGEPTAVIYDSADSISGDRYSDRREESERALKAIKTLLEESGRSDDALLIDFRKAILAGHYRREGFKDDALRLQKEAKANKKLLMKLKIGMVHRCISLFGRGGSALTLALAGKKSERR